MKKRCGKGMCLLYFWQLWCSMGSTGAACYSAERQGKKIPAYKRSNNRLNGERIRKQGHRKNRSHRIAEVVGRKMEKREELQDTETEKEKKQKAEEDRKKKEEEKRQREEAEASIRIVDKIAEQTL